MTTEVVEAFVAAYRPYVGGRLSALGIDIDSDLEASIEDGVRWLEAELTMLVAQPFAEQRRGPLELFQEAMTHPTETLSQRGTDPIARDEAVARALPGDLYGLAPAASHELGEEAWHAHLAWGAAKAAAMRPPRRVGVLSANLMDRSKLDAALASGGFEAVAVRGALPEGLHLLVADLQQSGWQDVVTAAVADGVEVVVFGPHTDTHGLEEASRLGATKALPRSMVLRDPAQFVASL